MRFRKSTHSVYNTQYHIVWTPRYRRKLLVKGVKEYLEKLFKNMDRLDEDIEVRKVNVQKDHVHIVIVIPPRVLSCQCYKIYEINILKRRKGQMDGG